MEWASEASCPMKRTTSTNSEYLTNSHIYSCQRVYDVLVSP